MVEEKDTANEAPNLSAEEIERLVTFISRSHLGGDADTYAGHFLLLLDALAEEDDINDRREYVLAAQRALLPFTNAFFTTANALRQLGLETLRGDVERITVELKPDLNRGAE
jgi:hypothetical protein